LTPPRDWSEFYAALVKQAKADGAWVTTAGNVAGWFRKRRQVGISCEFGQDKLTISAHGNISSEILPPMVIRLHVPEKRKILADAEYCQDKEYIDIRLDRNKILVSFV